MPYILQDTPIEVSIDNQESYGELNFTDSSYGFSGWFMVSSVTVQSKTDIICNEIKIAIDDFGNVLTEPHTDYLQQCSWKFIDYCFDDPPPMLDDLLCEQEGATYALFQRKINPALDRFQECAEASLRSLESRLSSLTREADYNIENLSQFWRMSHLKSEIPTSLLQVSYLEYKRNQEQIRFDSCLSKFRRLLCEKEESFWCDVDILLEVESVCLFRWYSKEYYMCNFRNASTIINAQGTSIEKFQNEQRLRILVENDAKIILNELGWDLWYNLPHRLVPRRKKLVSMLESLDVRMKFIIKNPLLIDYLILEKNKIWDIIVEIDKKVQSKYN